MSCEDLQQYDLNLKAFLPRYTSPKNLFDLFDFVILLMDKNPAPVDMVVYQFIPLFTRCYTTPVVQDFFHQQYVSICSFLVVFNGTSCKE